MKNTKGINQFLLSAIAGSMIILASSTANAAMTKDEILASAVASCESAAANKYGDKAVKSTSSRVKWSKGLNGAEVKMKIKRKAKGVKKYSCIVGLDESVVFYRL